MHKIRSMTDKYNLDLTITLDYVPDEYDYHLILLDKHARLLGVGKSNGSGGKSITIPNWCMQDEGYTLKVQTSDGQDVISEESYSLSFYENTLHMEYMRMRQNVNFECVVRRKLWEKNIDETNQSRNMRSPSKYQRCQYEERYMEQMDTIYCDGKEFYA